MTIAQNKTIRAPIASIQHLSAYPPTTSNAVQTYQNRDYYEQALIPALEQAEKFIHIAMLTLDASTHLGQLVFNTLLERKAAHPHMHIRVRLDGLMSQGIWPWSATQKAVKTLKQAGVEVQINHVFPQGLEHRKLIIVDGKVAFFGGSCLSSEYYANKTWNKLYQKAVSGGKGSVEHFLNYSRPPDPKTNEHSNPPDPKTNEQHNKPQFCDIAFQYNGPSVSQLNATFVKNWNARNKNTKHILQSCLSTILCERYVDHQATYPTPYADITPAAESDVQVFHSEKGDGIFSSLLLNTIASAQKSLIMSFTYVLVPSFVKALQEAAMRGVDITILIPGVEGYDKAVPFWFFRSQYAKLIKTKHVRILEYRGYNHGKFIMCDDTSVLTTTGNPEPFSWNFGTDTSASIRNQAFIDEIKQEIYARDFNPAEERCDEITLKQIQNLSFLNKIKMFFSKLLIHGLYIFLHQGKPERQLVFSYNENNLKNDNLSP